MFFTAGGSHGQARRGYVTVYGRIFPWKWTWEMASIMRDVVDEKCKKCAIYQVQSACWNYPGGLTNDSALYCSVVASLHKSQIVCQDRDGGSWRHCEAGHRCLLLTTRDLNEIPREISKCSEKAQFQVDSYQGVRERAWVSNLLIGCRQKRSGK